MCLLTGRTIRSRSGLFSAACPPMIPGLALAMYLAISIWPFYLPQTYSGGKQRPKSPGPCSFSRPRHTNTTTLAASSSFLDEPRARGAARSCSEGLEQLDRIAGWVLDKNLLAAVAGDDLVTEPGSCSLQHRDK